MFQVVEDAEDEKMNTVEEPNLSSSKDCDDDGMVIIMVIVLRGRLYGVFSFPGLNSALLTGLKFQPWLRYKNLIKSKWLPVSLQFQNVTNKVPF